MDESSSEGEMPLKPQEVIDERNRHHVRTAKSELMRHHGDADPYAEERPDSAEADADWFEDYYSN
jgi:hypothetical protein